MKDEQQARETGRWPRFKQNERERVNFNPRQLVKCQIPETKRQRIAWVRKVRYQGRRPVQRPVLERVKMSGGVD